MLLARVEGNRASRGGGQRVRGRGRAGCRIDPGDQCGPPPRMRFEQNLEEEQRVSYAAECAREGRWQSQALMQQDTCGSKKGPVWLELGGQERVRGGEAGKVNGAAERPWWQSLQKLGLLLRVKPELIARPGVGPRHDLTSISKGHSGCWHEAGVWQGLGQGWDATSSYPG